MLKLLRKKKSQKVSQVRNRVSQRGSVGNWKQIDTPPSAATESTLMFKTDMVEGSLKMRFSFSNSHVQNKGQTVSKFALSQVNEFQLEVKSTEGKFALRQKTLLHFYSYCRDGYRAGSYCCRAGFRSSSLLVPFWKSIFGELFLEAVNATIAV